MVKKSEAMKKSALVEKLNELIDQGLIGAPSVEPDSSRLFGTQVILPVCTSYDTMWAEFDNEAAHNAELDRDPRRDIPREGQST